MNDLSGGATQSRTGLDEFAIRCIVVSQLPNLKKINNLAVLDCMVLVSSFGVEGQEKDTQRLPVPVIESSRLRLSLCRAPSAY